MRTKRLAVLPLVMLLASCSTDGGSSGTGITSAEGNVAGVRQGAAISALTTSTITAVEGIDVIVAGTSAVGETDAAGRFVVRGKFEGRVTLSFHRAGDGLAAHMTIIVPAGGTLTLRNVQIDVGSEAAVAESQHAVFDARVVAVDCGARTLSLASVGGDEGGDAYTLDLDGSFVHDGDGIAVDCGGLQRGDRVHVEGAVRADGTFGEADVGVER
jgi:hypothetical protein